MIAIHLLPFPFRGMNAPYLWVFHAALSKLGTEAAYILSADYLDASGRASDLSAEARKSLTRASYSLIPDTAMRAFVDNYSSRELAWHDYLTREIPQLTKLYQQALARLPTIADIRAVVTWCNCPSLVKACQERKIQVIHQELGSLRSPDYWPTIYFDSSGVNGDTEAEARYLRLQAGKQSLPYFSRRELLDILSATELDRKVQFRRGVALQVEDDSNIIAYAKGFNSTGLINQALEGVNPGEVLVRDHPAGHFTYRQRSTTEPARDESASTAGFLGRIGHLYTINSSVGAEALLHGISVTCLGEAPYRFVTTEPLDSTEFTRRLSFYCLNYLVPAGFLFDEEYLRWRLGSPSELEIQERHLGAYASRSLPPPFFTQAHFAQVFFDTGKGYSEEDSMVLPVRRGRQQLVFTGFPKDAAVRFLRFDPVNDAAAVRVEHVSLLAADDEPTTACISSTNADYADATGHYFLHEDPSIYLGLPGGQLIGLQRLTVDLEVIACGPAEVRSQVGHSGIEALASLRQLTAQRDQIAADYQIISAERDRVLHDLQQATAQRDHAATEREQMAAERQLVASDRDRVLGELQQMTAQRDQIASDREVISLERDRVLVDLHQMTVQRDQATTQRDQLAADREAVSLDRDRVLADLQRMTAQRDQAAAERDQIAGEQQATALELSRVSADLQQMAAQRDQTAGERDQIAAEQRLTVLERDRSLADLRQMTVQRDQAAAQFERACAERDFLATTVHLLKRTVSWRITAPLRRIAGSLWPTPSSGAWPRGPSVDELDSLAPAADTAQAVGNGAAADWNEPAAKLPNRHFAQLFVDSGAGFIEAGSIRRPVSRGRQQAVFSGFPHGLVVQSLRIDPVNDHAAVRVDRVLMTNRVGEQALGTPVALNPAHSDAEGCWFPHDDPQYLVDIPGTVRRDLKEVVVDMEVLALGQAEVTMGLRARRPETPQPVQLLFDQPSDGYAEAFEVLSGSEAALPAIALERDAAKLIAFYLPQYHRIQENSEWWGPGFTEWTNVIKGRPNYAEHHQPHLPRELGFYDLSNVEVMREQADMAKLYGLHGFCFYYYWFSGRRILEEPVEKFLASDIDLNYCLCWANENWTRTWDGDTRSVLMAQKYAESDPEDFIDSLLPYFNDPRYIRVDGKPMLVVYRAKDIPEVQTVFATWRRAVEAAGFPGLHIAVVDFYDITRADEVDADALVEFPPHKFNGVGSNPDVMPDITNPEFQGSIVDYAKVVAQSVNRERPDFTLYRTAMPSWDNTARRQNTPTILHGASPGLFGDWLRYLRAYTREHHAGRQDNFIFVNAWNEWGEGCHLEPDQKTGLRNLEAVAKSAWFEPATALKIVRERSLGAAMQSIAARHDGGDKR